jgi:D-alanyl-lipoteichoic acid acyltransferase DltB (MBOAT superfamily)
MSFTSLIFWVFLLITLILYWVVRKSKYQNLILLLGSLIFYTWFSPWYALLLVVSILVDYWICISIEKNPKNKRGLLVLSLILNIAVLLFFKFFSPFFNNLLSPLLQTRHINSPVALTVLLPIGLAFYTLKKISYVIDCYRGTLPAPTSLVDYALYVSFFPQIVSGPIDRAQKLIPQFQQDRKWKGDFFYSAWPLILMGLFKKIFVADNIKNIVDSIYSLQQPPILLFLVGTLGFMIEILADFSAYTDLARGIAFLMGIETSQNFNSPYFATSPYDFWNRWHITLSSWLRDYVFFPVRRAILSKKGHWEWLAVVIPPLVTMLVSGIWHGTGWTFLVWGLYWGVLIVIYQLFANKNKSTNPSRVKKFFSWLLMIILIFFSWSIFRAYSVSWLMNIFLHSSFLGSRSVLVVVTVSLSLLALYTLPWLVKPLIDRIPKKYWAFETMYFVTITVLIIIYVRSSSPDFIYFQF